MLKQVELQLQIKGVYQTVDIDTKTSFSINHKQSDLSNPTATKIPFSNQISLPKTGLNNRVFSHMGIRSTADMFNPLALTNFRLYVNGSLYQSGYIVVEEVDVEENGYYKIRLYGGLGNFFDYMSKLPLSYLELDYTHSVDAERVNDLMINDNGKYGYAVTYQGEYDKFDSAQTQNKDGISDAIWAGSTTYGNVELDENKRNELGYSGEYRSYYQKPVLKLKPIIETILEKAEVDGFKIELDEDFFSNDNPYYNDIWLMANGYDVGDVPGGYGFSINEFGDTGTGKPNSSLMIDENTITPGLHTDEIPPGNFISSSDSAPIDCEVVVSNSIQVKAGETVSVKFLTKMIATFYDNSKDDQRYRYKFSNLICSLKIYDATTKNELTSNTPQNAGAQADVNARIFNRSNVEIKRPSNRDSSYFGEQNFAYDTPVNGGDRIIDNNTAWTYAQTWENDIDRDIIVVFHVTGNTWWKANKNPTRRYGVAFQVLEGGSIIVSGQKNPDDKRTGVQKTYSDMIGSDYSCFDLLMSYCKLFGLLFKVDSVTNNIKLLQRSNYYSDTVLDWNNRVDRNKKPVLEPLGFKFQKGIFRYNSLDTKYENVYRNNNSKEYGSFTVNTGYQLKDEEFNYLDGIIFDNCIMATDYSQYYASRSTVALKDNKQLPHLQGGDGSKVELNGFVLLFRKSDPQTLNRNVRITDDTDFMRSVGTICWNNSDTNFILTNKISNFVRTIKKGDEIYSLNFADTRNKYAESEEFQNMNSGIYDRYWRSYINDRLDNNCKLLTCDVFLSPSDVNGDILSKFVFISDAIWCIEEIAGYNPLSNGTTKVKLVKVKDIDNYLKQNNLSDEFKISYNNEVVFDNQVGQTPSTIIIDDSVTSLQLEITSSIYWSATSNVKISPYLSNEGSTIMDVEIPSGQKSSFVRFLYGTNTVTIRLERKKLYTVKASTINGTSATINGEASPLTVPEGEAVTLNATGSGSFLYWDINGVTNENKVVAMTVTEDVDAVAHFLASGQIRLYCDDAYTTISGVEKTGSYWVLNVGQSYSFNNSRSDFSGFLFSGDDEYSKAGSKTIENKHDSLSVYYNQVLLNVTIVNKSPLHNFSGDKIYIGGSSVDFDVSPSTTEKVTKNADPDSVITFDRLDYHYPIFSQNSFTSPGVYPLTITGERIGWDGDATEDVTQSGHSIISKVAYSPVPFAIVSDLTVNPKSGNGNTNISITLSGSGGTVTQKAGNFEYVLTLNQKEIKPIGWNGDGTISIQTNVAAGATSATATFYHNNTPLTLSTGLTKGGNTSDPDGSVRSVMTTSFSANTGAERQFTFTVQALGTAYIWMIRQVGSSSSNVTKIIAGNNITISPTSGVGDVTINALGSGVASVETSQDKYNTPWLLTNNNYISGSTLYTPFKRLVGGWGINVLSPYGSPDITLELAVKTSRWSHAMSTTPISANSYYMQLISGTGFSTIHAVIPAIIFSSNLNYPVSVQIYSGGAGWYAKVQNCSNNEVVIPSGTVLTALIFGV